MCSLVVRGRVLASDEELEGALACAAPDSGDEAVVHLVVRRTAKVGWSVQGSNSFELSILASDSADNVQRWLSPVAAAATVIAARQPVLTSWLFCQIRR